MHPLRRFTQRVLRKLLRLSGDTPPYPPLESLPDAPDLFFQIRHFYAQPALKRRPGGWEYAGKFYGDYLTVGGACNGIVRTARHYCLGQGLDIGAGLWPLPGAQPVDIWRGPGANRNLDDIPDASADYVFSSHCLEHVERWEPELDRWAAKVKPGGIIFLYLPHPECGIWNPGSPMVGSEHKWQPTPVIIKSALLARGFSVVASDDGPDVMMSFYVCGSKSAGK